MEQIDILIIGAGPAGTVAASIARQNGLQVKIVEKQRFPRFTIGESLLPRCMEHLDRAGFLPALKEQGFQIKKGAKFHKQDKVCSFVFDEQFSEGWTWTWQVQRARFDKVLADEVEKMGVAIEYQTTVTDVQQLADGVVVTIIDQHNQTKQYKAGFIIDASGRGRVLAKLFDLVAPSDFPPKTALYTHIAKNPTEEQDKIAVYIPHADLWIWSIPFADGSNSIGIVGNPDFFSGHPDAPERRFRALIEMVPELHQSVEKTALLFSPIQISGYSGKVKKLCGERFALTGDATEFLDPIFSSGVTLAIESGQLAGELASRQLKGQEVDWQREFVQHLQYGIDVFRVYVKAWYDGSLQDVFFSPYVDAEIKRKVCSVLAGYVWDRNNPFAAKAQRAVVSLVKVVRARL